MMSHRSFRTRPDATCVRSKMTSSTIMVARRTPERKGGSGRKSKLDKSNKGLKAAAVLLNLGTSPAKAVEICNKMNKEDHPDDFDEKYKISAKTLLYTIKKYSTVMLSKTLRRKTGSRDTNSKWAIARLVEAKQIIEQLKLGKKMDLEQLTWEQVRRDYKIMPLWSDGILSVDEGHCKAHLSGGHTGSTNTPPVPCCDGPRDR